MGRHSLLVWVGAFVLYVIHCFPATYTIMMHRTATILGQWAKIEGRVSPTFYNQYVYSKINIGYMAYYQFLQID